MKLFSEYRNLRKEIYILCFGRTMTNLGSMIWPMFTLILNQKLGLNATEIALAMLIYSVASIPVSLFGGKLADKYNKKHLIVLCDCVSIAAYLGCAAVPVTRGSVIAFAAASLFQTVEWPAYESLIADMTTSADRERAFSLHYLGANLGSVLAPTLGGLLFKSHLNLAFFISGVSIAASTVLIAFCIRDIHRTVDCSEAGKYEAELDDGVSAIRYIFSNRVVLLFILVSVLGYGIYDMYGYLMPLDLTAVHGDQGSVLYGTMTSLNCVIVVAFTAAITRWFRGVSDGGKLLLGETLIGLGYVVFVLAVRSPILCYGSMVIFTIGEIFDTLASSPFLTRRIPASHRGRIMSIMNVSTTCFQSLFQLGAGKLYDTRGSGAAWGAVFAVILVLLLLLLVLQRLDAEDYPALQK